MLENSTLSLFSTNVKSLQAYYKVIQLQSATKYYGNIMFKIPPLPLFIIANP